MDNTDIIWIYEVRYFIVHL